MYNNNNLQFFEQQRQKIAEMQKEYNTRMQQLNTEMRSFNPYQQQQQQYQQFLQWQQMQQQQQQPTQETQQVQQQANTGSEEMPATLQMVSILGEIRTLLNDIKSGNAGSNVEGSGKKESVVKEVKQTKITKDA